MSEYKPSAPDAKVETERPLFKFKVGGTTAVAAKRGQQPDLVAYIEIDKGSPGTQEEKNEFLRVLDGMFRERHLDQNPLRRLVGTMFMRSHAQALAEIEQQADARLSLLGSVAFQAEVWKAVDAAKQAKRMAVEAGIIRE